MQRVMGSFGAGADGHLIKPDPTEVLMAVRAVAAGEQVVCARSKALLPKVVAQSDANSPTAVQPPPRKKLTATEKRVLRLMRKGFSYKEIAEEMGISARTVNTHTDSIFGKLSVHRRADL
jgi:DNA-binding NarL/FixJ family response regulator